MNEWFANPLFWIAFVSLLSVAAGAIFASGQWKGKADSDRESFKELVAEVRSDIKEILSRLPPPTVDTNGLLRLADLGKSFQTPRGALDSSARLGGIDASIRTM